MNVKQLNEELEKFLAINEVSDEVKERVLNKRKEQADRANKKLAKSTELMAKSNVGTPKTITVTFESGFCETEEDNYEEGALGSRGSYWSNKDSKSFELDLSDPNFAKTLAEKAGEYLYCYWVGDDIRNIRLESIDGEYLLEFCVHGTEDNDEPSESEWEQFRNCEINLWIIDGSIKLDIAENDMPYLIEALKKADVEVNV